MYKTLVLFAAGLSSALAAPQNETPTGVALGQQCDASIPNVCAGGANCYATNSMLITVCGNFQASCSTDAQCAFNTCNNGLCNGFKPSTSASTTPGLPKPTGTNLPLGADCDPSVPAQCANGVSCYATNSMLIPRCGNFQSLCTSDAMCAYNTCVDGFCRGFIASTTTGSSQSSTPSPSTTTPSVPKPTGTNLPLGEACDPDLPNVCANGVSCYATNSMLQPRCGNFQSLCTSDSMCAYNTCVNGFCSGFIASSSSSSSASSTSSPPFTNSSTSSTASASASTTTTTTSNRITTTSSQSPPPVVTTSSPLPSVTTTIVIPITTAPGQDQPNYTTLTTVVPGQLPSSSATRAPASTSPVLQANSGSHVEGGLVGVFGLVIAALML